MPFGSTDALAQNANDPAVTYMSTVSPNTFGFDTNRCLKFAPTFMQLNGHTWKDKYSARFTYCMRIMLEEATKTLLLAVENYLDTAFYAVALLATIMMGMKAVGGMFRNVKVEVMIFVVRLGAVMLAYENLPAIASFLYDVTDELIFLVAKAASVGFSKTGAVSTMCENLFKTDDTLDFDQFGDYKWIAILDWMDCLFGKLYGLTQIDDVRAGMLALISSTAFSGTMGVHLSMLIITTFTAILLFMLRVTTMLVMAYGALSLMMMMLPIVLLGSFFKATEQYFFRRWLGKVTATVLAPAITIGFTFFALTALNTLIYQGSTHRVQYNAVVNDQVIRPIHDIIELDKTWFMPQQIAHVNKFIKQAEPSEFFKFSLRGEGMVANQFRIYCGDKGFFRNFIEAGFELAKDGVEVAVGYVTPSLADEAKEVLRRGPDDPQYNKMVRIACGAANSFIDIDFFNDYLENKVNSYIPTFYFVDFTELAEPGESPEDAQERVVTQLIIASFALFVLASMLYGIMNKIESIAQTITGYIGLSGSVMESASGEGGGLMNTIKSGLIQMDNNWTKASVDPNLGPMERISGMFRNNSRSR